MKEKKTVLITGTTSGIGLGLLDHYYGLGHRVVSINRRADSDLEAKYSKAHFFVGDITSYAEMNQLVDQLVSQGLTPNLVVLNAGINKPDNFPDRFDYPAFEEVMRINLFGSMVLVAVLKNRGLSGLTFVGISSTSNIVPNPGHFSYYLTKWGIASGFKMFQKNDNRNSYKWVVLGPIRTQVMRYYEGPSGFNKRLLNFLMRDVNQLVPALTSFIESRRSVLYYPFGVCLFYWCANQGLKLIPFLYKGTQKELPGPKASSAAKV